MSEQQLNDGTPTNDPAAALHWAAVAYNLAASREGRGQFLTVDEQASFTRYQSAARLHGYTDRDVRAYAATLGAGGDPVAGKTTLPQPTADRVQLAIHCARDTLAQSEAVPLDNPVAVADMVGRLQATVETLLAVIDEARPVTA